MSLPIVLQGQLADLGVQRLNVRTRLPLFRSRGKNLSGPLHQLRLPLRDLVRVHIVSLSQSRQRLVALHGRYRPLRLEGR